ncbi:MAG: ERCC4 domain-containing protein [Candidatus Hodarchaeota archaeon]
MLRNIEPRSYQQIIFGEVASKNSLVVLPTGLGKTVIIAYLIAHTLSKKIEHKILLLTPTRPLVHQAARMMREFIDIDPDFVLEVSGEISASKREKLYLDAQIVVGTPQTIRNDILFDRIDIQQISLVCIDEAHRAVGNYAYVEIIKQLPETVHIIGFTATPGNTEDQVLEVVKNLRTEKVTVRTADSPDVREYTTLIRPQILWVELPDSYKNSLKLLEQYRKRLEQEIANIDPQLIEDAQTKSGALQIQQKVITFSQKNQNYLSLLIPSANLIRTIHLKDIIESQGFPQALETLRKWKKKKQTRALSIFLEDSKIRFLKTIIQENSSPHPKLSLLIELLSEIPSNGESKAIVFSNYRDTVRFLHKELEKEEILTGVFIGQSSQIRDKGMSQKEQIAIMEEFRKGSLNILVATSVAEEGLDVGNCDLVIFYDSVPSIIRTIQRTGRGRKKHSKIVRLITKGTRDASMHFAVENRKKHMNRFLLHELPQILQEKAQIPLTTHEVKEQLKQSQETSLTQKTLLEFANSDKLNTQKIIEESMNDEIKLQVIVDTREAASIVPRALKRMNIQLLPNALPIGDYIVSDRVCIERKTVQDFVASIVDGRLFESQLIELNSAFERPIIIIEGQFEQLGSSMNPQAIRGALSSIILDFKIPIIQTNNAIETAEWILILAQREQRRFKRKPTIVSSSAGLSDNEIRARLLSTIPGINLSRAYALLNSFRSIKELASQDPLTIQQTPGIGKKLAKKINDILNAPHAKFNPQNDEPEESS